MSVNQGVMRIGEVHAELRRDFPDIELSKIRYYEDKGLVQPSRSRKGYRLYSERDLACLREAIRLANEEFVPLRVVRLRLIEQGLIEDVPTSSTRRVAREAKTNVVSIPAPTGSTSSTRPALSVVQSSTIDEAMPETRVLSPAEFAVITGLDASTLAQLQSLGLITPEIGADGVIFGDIDVRVAGVAAVLMARGVDIRILGSLRRVADREVGLIEELTAPVREKGSGVSPEKAYAITAEVAGEVAALRAALYERALHNYLGR